MTTRFYKSHTPGPWRYCGTGGSFNIRSDNHQDGEGALLFLSGPMFHDYAPDLKENHANAALIAAAPELLAELKNLVFLDTNHDSAHAVDWEEGFKQARNTIEKAEGN